MGKISKLRLSSPEQKQPRKAEEGVNREELAVLLAEQKCETKKRTGNKITKKKGFQSID